MLIFLVLLWLELLEAPLVLAHMLAQLEEVQAAPAHRLMEALEEVAEGADMVM